MHRTPPNPNPNPNPSPNPNPRIHAQDTSGRVGVLELSNIELRENMRHLSLKNAHLEAMLTEAREQQHMSTQAAIEEKQNANIGMEAAASTRAEVMQLQELNSILESKNQTADRENKLLVAEVERIKQLGSREITELRGGLEEAKGCLKMEQGNFLELMNKA